MPDLSNLAAEILKTVKVKGTVEVLHKPGAVKLDGFPGLCYAPGQWGPGIRTENNGTPVADIATAYSEMSGNTDAVAAKFGVTVDHVVDAVKYAMQAGYLEGGE